MLKKRLADLVNRYPILNARPGGIFLPKWKLPRRPITPQIRIHRDAPNLRQQLFNEPLAMKRGELLRFDLVERDGGRMDFIFTWAHTLMDANSAEHFLAVVGREEIPLPATQTGIAATSKETVEGTVQTCVEKHSSARHILQSRAAFRWIAPSGFAGPPEISRRKIFRRGNRAHPRQRRAALRRSRRRAISRVVSMVELHRLHQRLGCASPSYVLPMPVGLRPKGSVEPLFSNQVTMLMLSFCRSNLARPPKPSPR